MKSSALPYHDSKPQGAPDFYFGINATFRFLIQRKGIAGWRRYVEDMARKYYQPVWAKWSGLPAVAAWLREAFAAEPGAVFEVTEQNDRVVLDVRECPAIKHLRAHGREIVAEYCQHCYFQGETMSRHAGMTMRLEGGNGCCRQTFYATAEGVPPQDVQAIRRAS